jgi:hypothetical protein
LVLVTPVAAYPGYFISPDGPVYYRNRSGELQPLKIRRRALGRLYVRIYVDGRRHELGIKKLLIDTFLKGEAREAESSIGHGG